MQIDDAIMHCKEIAEKYMEYGIETECYQCGKEHEQLAEWLTELKKLRQLQNSINKAAKLCEKCLDTSECPMFYPYLKEGDLDAES